MIGRLVGRVITEALDGFVLIDVNGVGYELVTPIGTVGRATAADDGRVILYTHAHVREDALELYGFSSDEERNVFRLLVSVPNVGPKTAVGVLSSLPPPELSRAVEGKDLERLNKINGVGKKTAERLVLELREKLPKLGQLAARPAEGGPSEGDGQRLVGALTKMGYRPADAQRALQALGERVGQEPLSDLLRDALGQLAR